MNFSNHFKTFVLLGILTAIFVFIGSFFGDTGIIFAFGFAMLMNFFSYFFSDKLVIKMYGGKEVKNGKLYSTVNNLSKRANLPMPKVYVCSLKVPNAFATGRNPKHAAVCVTSSLLDLLNEDELKGVLAHELTHVKNRDILVSTIASVIAMSISYLAYSLRWFAFLGGGNNRDGRSPFELIAVAIFVPIAASMIRLAISRSREYLADYGSAKITKNPNGLISALNKLENYSGVLKSSTARNATSNMFIINPFKSEGLLSLFMTHPTTKDRIKKLNEFKS